VAQQKEKQQQNGINKRLKRGKQIIFVLDRSPKSNNNDNSSRVAEKKG